MVRETERGRKYDAAFLHSAQKRKTVTFVTEFGLILK